MIRPTCSLSDPNEVRHSTPALSHLCSARHFHHTEICDCDQSLVLIIDECSKEDASDRFAMVHV